MKALIGAEVTLAFVLLTGAGLLLRSAQRLEAVELGFDSSHVAVLDFAMGGLAGSRYNDAPWRSRFFQQLLDRAAREPGVQAAGLVSQPPLSGGSYNGSLSLDTPGQRSGEPGYEAHYRLIGGEYLAAMRIPLLEGRPFAAGDGERDPKVAMVNQRLAERLAPGGRPLGLRVKIPGVDGVDEWAEIVGVVANVHHRGASLEASPEIYFPFVQRPRRTWMMSLVVRSGEQPASLASRLRRQVRALDRGAPFRFRTLDELVANDLAQPRFRARLLASFAATALLLAAVGIFGVVSYVMGQRTRDIGIRVALGAGRPAVGAFVLWQGMAPVLLGIAVGLAASLILMRLLAGFLFQVAVTDPLTLASVALALTLAAAAASLLPARRALRVDPIQVLRSE